MSARWFATLGFCSSTFVLVAACGELKTASPVDEPDESSESSGNLPGSSGGTSGASGSSGTSGTSGASGGFNGTRKEPPPPGFGPGPQGSLPSGYCCNDDSECRSRRCEDLGGGKMCLDWCYGDSFCRRPPDLSWTCDNTATPGERGHCRPSGAFACIPAAQFEHGTRPTGDCCTPTGDGWAGLECLGGGCVAIGESPFVCSQRCEKPKDCPSGFICHAFDETRKECIPANRPYTCN